MPSSNPTTLTFCEFLQLLVGKTHEFAKTAINEKFISQFLLPLVCKTHEFAKIAKNQIFAPVAIPIRNLVRLSLTKKYNAISVMNNLRSKFFIMYIVAMNNLRMQARKTTSLVFVMYIVVNYIEAVAIPAGNLVRLSLTKKYNAISVMNNLRSKFFIMYIVINYIEAVAIPIRNLVRLCLTKPYKTSRVMNNQRSWFFINYIEAVAIPAGNLVGLCLTKPYKTSRVMNNQRSWFFIIYIVIMYIAKKPNYN